MTKSRAILGLCIACALLVSAFAAQSASAETTAFTCSKEVTTKTWSDAHCTNSTSGTKEDGHVAVAENTTTATTASPGTSKPIQKLRATIGGINTELVTTTVSGAGSMHNTTVNGEMQATGTGTKTYTAVTVAAPANKGCKVYTDTVEKEKGEEGVVHTREIKASTTSEMGVKFEPNVGNVFATFIIEGCAGSEALKGLNKTYEVTGSVIGVPNGGEVVFEHAATTAQNTLKINGLKAGIDGSTTIQGRHAEKPLEEFKALTATTPPYATD
jgi:hypothetical protein